MGFMDKVKNLFTEEVEEEIEVKEEPIKKEMIQVEIPAPVRNPQSEIMTPEVKEEPKKEEFNFPFFDDEDFHEMDDPEPKPKEEKKKRANTHKEAREVYSPVKEEKKVFKPTPIISPVYGILDKNYNKDDIKKQQRPRSYYNPKEASVDEIRNKAYGTLEDDIETTLFGRNHLMFDDIPKEEPETLEVKKEIKEEPKEEYTDNLIGERPRHGADEEPDITELLEAELGKEEKEEPKEDKKPHKISDSELFSMIDSMYQKGDK